jgi:hypothetical protein
VNPSGTALVYAGFLGGSSYEEGYGIAVDSSGNAYVTGWTGSSDFPAVVGPDTSYNGYGDAFVAKVNPSGTALVYSGFLGGSGGDVGYGIAVDSSGNAYVTGETSSSDFPAVVGPDLSYNGGGDAFVAKVGAGATYSISGRVVDGSGNPISGVTVSDNAGHTTTTGSDGRYTLSGLAAGTYTLTPSKSGYTFSPPSRAVTVPPDATGVDFVGYQITIAHIEVSQATQTDTNSVPLIAMKSALVRVYLSSDSSVSFVEGITGRLTVIREEGSARTVVGSVPALNALKSIALFVFRTHDLDETLNFLVPASMMQGTVSFHVQVFQGEREVAGGESGPWSLERIRPLQALVVPVACTDGSIPDFTPEDLVNAYAAVADRMLPLPRTSLTLTLKTLVFPCRLGGYILLNRLSLWRLLSGETSDYILGITPAGKFGDVVGWGSHTLRAAWVEDDSLKWRYVLPHEVGHVLNAPHLPNVEGWGTGEFKYINCPEKEPADITREWGDGQIKEYGVYVGRRPAGIPRTHPDVMTYCRWLGPGLQDDRYTIIEQWISPYSYQRMLSTLRSWSGLRAQGAAGARLLASGVVYTDGQAVLDPFWVLTPTGSVENPPAGTRYCLEILGEGDSRLAGHCFDLGLTQLG